jgi:hypothetical protein
MVLIPRARRSGRGRRFVRLLRSVLDICFLRLARRGRPAPLAAALAAVAALAVLALLGAAAPPAFGAAPLGALEAAAQKAGDAAGGEVTLPLRDYLALVDRGDAIERERAESAAHGEAPVAEVVAQRTVVRIGDRVAEVTARFEALVQGHPKEPLRLPFAGLLAGAEVQRLAVSGGPPVAAAALSASPASAAGGPGLELVAPAPGRYAIVVHGRAALADREGVRRLELAPVAAPVAEVEIDLAADLAWSAPGAVVVDDRVAGGRRTLRLATARGAAQTLEIRRRLDDTEAEKLLARSVVLTLFQLRPEGFRRHDVVLYEVSRGSLGRFTVDLPPGLDVEQVATDEGDVVPVVEARRLTVERRRRLTGTGYLVLTSTPRGEGAPAAQTAPFRLPAVPLSPAVEVRARYLALASSVAAAAAPAPAADWLRVDFDDLPPSLGQELQSLDLLAAWRLQLPAAAGERAAVSPAGPRPLPDDLALGISLLPPAPRLAAVVRERETTTLVTVDGTVVHRDRFTLEPLAQPAASLDVTLPAGAILWSAGVAGQPVRPVDRNGSLSIPLGFAAAGEPPVVEVVTVAEHTVPGGRSRLALALPQVAATVLAHRWHLLLPEGAQYRVRAGTLRGVQEVKAEASPALRSPITFIPLGGTRSDVQGNLTDGRGSRLPGVTVELRSAALRQPWRVTTRGDGSFYLADVAPGRYTVHTELEGFSSVDFPFVLAPGQRADLQIVMRPASIPETITVSTGTTMSRGELDRIATAEAAAPLETPELEAAARDAFRKDANELKQGLVGGVKPLPVTIPEDGKALLLTGALPPAQVAVELEVRERRKGR